MRPLADLDAAVKAVCPIDGLSPSSVDSRIVTIHFRGEATSGQMAAAETIVAGWDWDAPETVRFVAPNTFRKLFTQQERFTIYASSDPLVMDFMGDLQTLRDDVDLQHSDTLAGVGYLVATGLITQQRADRILSGQGPI